MEVINRWVADINQVVCEEVEEEKEQEAGM